MLGITEASCVEELERPKLDHVCFVDEDIDGCACSKGGGVKFNLTIHECDGHKAISVRDAEKIDDYVIKLEKKVLELQKPK